ncbi:MAG: general secretion pathway protein GspK [bacterium]
MIDKYFHIGDRGVALMMILWVLILLDIIVLQFASSMRTEMEITRNFRDRVESYYLARAAMELARFELAYVASVSKSTTVADNDGVLDFRFEDEGRDTNPQWNREVAFGRGIFSIDYSVKEGKYDLNHLVTSRNESDLEEVLIACGVEEASTELSMLKRSIIDWADDDHDLTGPDIGAEDDWYKDNWQGYECKDDRFYSVEELALIRGLRLEKGDSEEERDEKKRLLSELYKRVTAHPFLTHNKLNRNVMSPPVGGMEYPDGVPEMPIDKIRPNHYEVIASGWIKGSPVERKIRAEFQIKGRKKVELLSWTDNYIPLEEWDPNQVIEGDEDT